MGIERLREPCPKWAANEIDRLRTELASRKIDVETFSEGNRQLRAELAAMTKRAEAAEDNIGCQADLEKDFADARAELAALEECCIDGEKVILRCNKKITEVEIWNKEYRDQLAEARRALLASNDIVLANKKLQEDNAAKDGIIANLNERSAQYERDTAAANARIAGLEGASEDTPFEAVHAHIREGVLRAAEEIRQRDDVRAAHEIMASACQRAANRLNSELSKMVEVRARAERADAQLAEANADLVLVQKALATQHEYHKITLDSRDELREQWALAVVRAERAEAELVDVQVFNHELDDKLELANVRIAELEDKLSTAVWSRDHERADNEILHKRIAELEAELKLLRGDIKIIDALQAERDAMREALEGMIAVAEGRFDGNPHADIDALAKARAALAPSPAGREG